MKLHYDPKTDSLYIELNGKAGADSQEIADGVVVDVDADGNPVGIDIEYASQKLTSAPWRRSRSRWRRRR